MTSNLHRRREAKVARRRKRVADGTRRNRFNHIGVTHNRKRRFRIGAGGRKKATT